MSARENRRTSSPHHAHHALSGDAVRARGLATGLVDNKVCAVDETWSGLRFVRRLADR